MLVRTAFVVAAILSASMCKGPTFGLGAGTQACKASRVVDGVIVDNNGETFLWKMRRKATGSRSVSMGWGEHRDLKAKHCKGQRSYSIETVIKVCMNAEGHVTKTNIEQASLAPEFDKKLAAAMKSNRYCALPTDSPHSKACRLQRLDLTAPCD